MSSFYYYYYYVINSHFCILFQCISHQAGSEQDGNPNEEEELLPTETFAHDDTDSVRTIQLRLIRSVGHEDRRVKDTLQNFNQK